MAKLSDRCWTVSRLIKELKKWPGNLPVACAAHDNNDDEIQNTVGRADLLEDGEMKQEYGECLVLRP